MHFFRPERSNWPAEPLCIASCSGANLKLQSLAEAAMAQRRVIPAEILPRAGEHSPRGGGTLGRRLEIREAVMLEGVRADEQQVLALERREARGLALAGDESAQDSPEWPGHAAARGEGVWVFELDEEHAPGIPFRGPDLANRAVGDLFVEVFGAELRGGSVEGDVFDIGGALVDRPAERVDEQSLDEAFLIVRGRESVFDVVR